MEQTTPVTTKTLLDVHPGDSVFVTKGPGPRRPADILGEWLPVTQAHQWLNHANQLRVTLTLRGNNARPTTVQGSATTRIEVWS